MRQEAAGRSKEGNRPGEVGGHRLRRRGIGTFYKEAKI